VRRRKGKREKEADSDYSISAHREETRGEEKEGEKDRKRKCHRTRLIRFAPSGPVNRETDGSTAEICSRSPNTSRRLRRVKFSGRLDYPSFMIIPAFSTAFVSISDPWTFMLYLAVYARREFFLRIYLENMVVLGQHCISKNFM